MDGEYPVQDEREERILRYVCEILSQAFAVSGVRLFDGKSGTGGLWMTHVIPPVLLNKGHSPSCIRCSTIYVNFSVYPITQLYLG